jgi:hypothetical protein
LRKITAIVLICLLAFNWYGYRLLIHYLEDQTDTVLQQKLDKQEYAEHELIELRVPLHLPYLSDWKEFQPYDGETTINGRNYRYVKRKLERGELVLVCMPNKQKDKITTAGHDYFKRVNDLPPEKKGKNNQKVQKSILNEFYYSEPSLSQRYFLNGERKFSRFHERLSSLELPPPTQPPNNGSI